MAYVISFIVKLYLILINNIKTFDMEGFILSHWKKNPIEGEERKYLSRLANFHVTTKKTYN